MSRVSWSIVVCKPIGPAVREDFRCLYPANAKMPTCCPSDDNRTKVTNSVTSAQSLWWHVGPYFWPTDLTRTANPIIKWQNPSFKWLHCALNWPNTPQELTNMWQKDRLWLQWLLCSGPPCHVIPLLTNSHPPVMTLAKSDARSHTWV